MRRAEIQDPGFGSRYEKATKRVINKDGSFNVIRNGVEQGVQSMFQELVEMGTGKFILILVCGYLLMNLIFASAYFLIGPEHLSGSEDKAGLDAFLHCFFFSFQTFTTVGYGAIAPTGVATNVIAALEAFSGLLSFALATGLLWGRFSRPRSRVLFSNKALIAPFKEGTSLQVRLVNKRRNVLMDLEARMILVSHDPDSKDFNRQYFQMPLELNQVSFLPLSWTLVHKIDDSSPLYQWTEADLKKRGAEVLVLISGFDDTFHQVVHARYSYLFSEIVFGAKFIRPFNADQEGNVVMDIHDIHRYESTELPV